MQNPSLSYVKRIGDSLKSGCRYLCRPLLPILPGLLLNRFPFMGRVCVHGPNQLRIWFHTYGREGKDRIAIKLARRGIGAYEGETTRIFLGLIEHAQTIVDVGANTGLFAMLAAIKKPKSRVIAFEPVPFIFALLQENIKLNKIRNIEAIPVAVADSLGESTLYVTRTSVGIPTDSSLCKGFRAAVEECKVTTIRLDDYIERHAIAKVDLLKIDVEAAEHKVIAGALQTIKRDLPFIIAEVLENVDHSYIQATLAGLNYRFYHILPGRLEQRSYLQGSLDGEKRNYLFVPPGKDFVMA